jgi:hypothetical protein
MMKIIFSLFLWGIMGCGVGMGGEENGTFATETVTQSETWGYVGQYRAKIVPEQVRVFTMPSAGRLTGLIEAGHVAKGVVFAKITEED